MSRLLFRVSVDPQPVRPLLEEFVEVVKGERGKHEYNRYGRRDWPCTDGWGMAWRSRGGPLELRRSVGSYLDEVPLLEFDETTADVVVLHARKASVRARTKAENLHPFVRDLGAPPPPRTPDPDLAEGEPLIRVGGEWLFAHVGVIGSDMAQPVRLQREGESDSEALFVDLLCDMPGEAERQPDYLYNRLLTLRDFSGLTSVLISGQSAYVACFIGRDPAYHALFRGAADGVFYAASEPLPHLGLHWTSLPASSLLTIPLGAIHRRGTTTVVNAGGGNGEASPPRKLDVRDYQPAVDWDLS